MKIVFRTDASITIGTGHVMRCLTLAGALKEKGAEITFICREHSGHLIPLIELKGFHTVTLPTPREGIKFEEMALNSKLFHAEWLGVSQQQDAQQCLPFLSKNKPDWVVVDHYAIDSCWQRWLKPHYRRLMVIDDLADRYHDCDLLLDQTYGRKANDYEPLVSKDTKLLLGSTYALLRPEFAELRDYSLQRRYNPKLKELLVTMGGVDADNITGFILLALRDCSLPKDLKITVVMGSSAPALLQVKRIAEQMPYSTEVLVNVKNMAEIMANSDLAIGAAGSTSWERCCLGLPTLMIILAENQQVIAKGLQDFGAAKLFTLDRLEMVSSYIQAMTQNKLREMSKASVRIVDGLGVQRVLENIHLAG